jgi:hypothetical protein
MLCLLAGGVLLAGLMASDTQGISFAAALGTWIQLLALLAALATIGWGARLLWQGASGGAPIGRPLWVCSAVVLAIYAVFAALPVSQAEAIEQAQSWLVIAVNLLLSITLLIVSIDVKHPAGQDGPAASAERSGSLQLRSNAGVLIMLAGLALIAAIVSRGLLSVGWAQAYALPAGMLLCCAVPRPGWIRATLQAGRAAGRCAA